MDILQERVHQTIQMSVFVSALASISNLWQTIEELEYKRAWTNIIVYIDIITYHYSSVSDHSFMDQLTLHHLGQGGIRIT